MKNNIVEPYIFSSINLVDKKTKDAIQGFIKDEKEFINQARSQEGYKETLKVFAQNKNIKRVCEIIKTIYGDLKKEIIPFSNERQNDKTDFEIIVYERDLKTAKYAILFSIDTLQKLLYGIEKHTNYSDDVNIETLKGKSSSKR